MDKKALLDNLFDKASFSEEEKALVTKLMQGDDIAPLDEGIQKTINLICDPNVQNIDLTALHNNMLSIFESNRAYFKANNTNLYDLLCNYIPNDFSFYLQDSGFLNLTLDNKSLFYQSYNVDEYCQSQVQSFISHDLNSTKLDNVISEDWYGQIHKRYIEECYKKEALYKDELMRDNKIMSTPLIFCFGVGLGSYLNYLFAAVETQNIILIEPNLDLFYASLYTFDYASFLSFLKDNSINIEFILGDVKDSFLYRVESFLRHNGIFLGTVCSQYTHYKDRTMSEYLDLLNQNYCSLLNGVGFFDDSMFSLAHTNYILEHNINVVAKNRAIHYEYKDLPVFVVCNGPSLDNDLAFLRKNQDKALIVACGSTIETLFHEGIQADFYVAIERVPEVADFLCIFDNNDYLDNVILLTTNVIHKNVLKYFKHTAIFDKDNEPCSTFLNLNKETEQYTDLWNRAILCNPLVLNMALSALFELNFCNIYLFGADNGTKYKDKIHCSKSKIYNDYNGAGSFALGSGDVVLQGNFGGEVISSFIYSYSVNRVQYLYDNYKIKFNLDIDLKNCSDGALFECAKPLHSKDIDFSLHKVIDKDLFREDFMQSNTIKLNLDKDILQDNLNPQYFFTYIESIESYFKKDFKTRIEAVKLFNELNSYIVHEKRKREFCYASLMEGSMIAYLIYMLDALYSSEDESLCIKRAKDISKIVLYFLSDCKESYSHAKEYIMGEHLKCFDGKIGRDHGAYKAPTYVKNYVTLDTTKVISPYEFIKRYD